MTLAYIVTESQMATDILYHLLPKHLIQSVKLVPAKSQYSAQSLTASIMAAKAVSAVLVQNAGTDNAEIIEEKYDLLRYAFKGVSHGLPFEIFMAIPEIETVFVHDLAVLEYITQKSLNEWQWELAKLRPQKFLQENLDEDINDVSKIFSKVDEKMLLVWQQHPLIQKIADFLQCLLAKNSQET